MPGSARNSGPRLLLSAVVVVTAFSQAQEITPQKAKGSRLPDAPSAVARVWDNSKSALPKDSLNLMQDNTQRPSSWAGWSFLPGENPFAHHALSLQAGNARPAVLPGSEHSFLSARSGSLTFPPSYVHANTTTTHNADDWQHYAHHIPVAGPVALRIGQKAQAHPHVTNVFKVIQPQF